MISGMTRKCILAAIVAAMLACMCALGVAVPQEALAEGLTANSLTAQSNDNLTTDSAQPITLGKSATVEFSKSDMESGGFPNAYYWFSYCHSTRKSVYTIRVDSIDGVKCGVALYDGESVKQLKSVNLPSNSAYAAFFSYKVDSSDDYGKLRYVMVGTGHSWYGTSWSKEINEGSAFKVTVTEHPIIKQATGVKASKKTKKSITLKWSKQANATKYQVAVSGKRPITVTGNSKRITGLKAGKSYKVKVRAYCEGGWNASTDRASNWGPWSSVETVKTKKR